MKIYTLFWSNYIVFTELSTFKKATQKKLEYGHYLMLLKQKDAGKKQRMKQTKDKQISKNIFWKNDKYFVENNNNNKQKKILHKLYHPL